MDRIIKEPWPRITIITTTYYPNTDRGHMRANLASVCVKTWIYHIRYQGLLALHIADDGSEVEDGAIYPVRNSLISKEINPITKNIPVTLSRQERKGISASLNAGFQKAFESSPLAMYLVDDFVLRENIDLTAWAELLMDREDVGMVRFGLPHSDLTGKIIQYPQGSAVLIDRHHYAFSFRPALFHKRFFDAYGWFKEGSSAVQCERVYNLNFCQSEGPGIIFIIGNPWEHLYTLDLSEVNP